MPDYLIEETLSEFKKFSPIEKYKFIENHRSLLRDLQKISYRISQFDKKFPFETLKPEQYEEVLRVYLDFLLEARSVGLILGEDFLKE